MHTTQKERDEVLRRLDRLGIAYEDAQALRRIALTLRRWFELECGDGNDYGSWAIERDDTDTYICTKCGHHGDGLGDCGKCGDIAPLRHIATGFPYMVHHHYKHGKGPDFVTKRRIADKETGARKRLTVILAKYPSLHAYIQTDPRGASLYLLTAEQVASYNQPIESIYSYGVAVY